MRTEYEVQLLELRQSLKEVEKKLRNSKCVNMRTFRRLVRLRKVVHEELLNYRSGSEVKSPELLRLMGG